MLFASELAGRLAKDAEAVCRHYLSAGRRAGNYWVAGDVANSKGRSLYVNLIGPLAGRWTDAATGQFGDLLDLIRESCGLVEFREVAEEAHRFLRIPKAASASLPGGDIGNPDAIERPATEPARRMFRMTQPLAGTLADTYLRGRGILRAPVYAALRFHPTCYYRDLVTGRSTSYPALIAAVTDAGGAISGVHRTYLSPQPDGGVVGKANVADPRRALGRLLGNGVRLGYPFSEAVPVLAVGEGLETMLSLLHVMPGMPMVAALTATHLAAFLLPPGCRRIYIAADADAAGRIGVERLSRRAQTCGILPLVLSPELGDFNEDLCWLGPERLTANLRAQLTPDDAMVFLAT